MDSPLQRAATMEHKSHLPGLGDLETSHVALS